MRQTQKERNQQGLFFLNLNTFSKYILLPSGASPLKIEFRVLPHLEDKDVLEWLLAPIRVSGAPSPRHKTGKRVLARSYGLRVSGAPSHREQKTTFE